jgi:hypothetical protein
VEGCGVCRHVILITSGMRTTASPQWVLAIVLLAAAVLAQASQPAVTAGDVRRIALASAPGAGGNSRLATATSGLQQAMALNITIDYAALRRDPTLAQVRWTPSC